MTYEEAVAYLGSFVNYEHAHQPEAMRAVKLERMRRLCRRLGDPQRRFRSVLVAGTNGKGSICAMLYSMLRESPLRVGLYTSPHLEHPRERIRVWTHGPTAGDRTHGDDWIAAEEFSSLTARLAPVLEETRRGLAADPPTYFEVMTALAFLYFKERQVEIAVLEVGMGGRLDATNVAEQAVSVFAPIDVDHADVLGATPEAIAREKAGILKPHQVVVSAPQTEEVAAVLREACNRHGIPLLSDGYDFGASLYTHDLTGLRLAVRGPRGLHDPLAIPLIGRHQAQNAAAAVAALEALSPTGIPYSIIQRGLSQVAWPGRLEVVSDSPLILLDGAHNPHAAAALRETLLELCLGRAIHLLVGVSSDKSVEEIGERIGKLAVSVTCTKSRHPRSLDPTRLASRFFPYCHDVHVMADPVDAYTYLLNTVSPQDVIVVTGSLFLVGELRAALRHAHIHARRFPSLEAAAAEDIA